MEDAKSIDLLNRVLHGTVNSVIQYVDIARPYVPPGCESDVEELRRLRDEEAVTVGALTALITELDGVPKVDPFDYWNVDLNYLDLRFLARFAAQHQDKVIAEIEAHLDDVRDDARVHRLLREIVAEKSAHKDVLLKVAEKPDPEVDPELKAKAQPPDCQHVPRPVRE
ncbi:MAG: ferritin-like domain-containing protein [Planctomycetota bacterium]|jgi:bacterioferritin (cytochrome b1)